MVRYLIVLVGILAVAGCDRTGSANIGSTSDTSVDASETLDVRNQISLDTRKASEVRVPAWAPFVAHVIDGMPPDLSLPTKTNFGLLPYAALRLDGQGGIRVSSKLLRKLAQRPTEACALLRSEPELHPGAYKVMDEMEGEAKVYIENPQNWKGAEYNCLREGLVLAAFTSASWGAVSWPAGLSPIDTPEAAEFFIHSVGVNTKFVAEAIEEIQSIAAPKTKEADAVDEVFRQAIAEFAASDRFNAAVESAALFAQGVVQLATGTSNEFPVQGQVSGQIVGLDSKGANLIAYGKPWFGAGVVAGGSWDISMYASSSAGLSRAASATERGSSGTRATTDISTR